MYGFNKHRVPWLHPRAFGRSGLSIYIFICWFLPCTPSHTRAGTPRNPAKLEPHPRTCMTHLRRMWDNRRGAGETKKGTCHNTLTGRAAKLNKQLQLKTQGHAVYKSMKLSCRTCCGIAQAAYASCKHHAGVLKGPAKVPDAQPVGRHAEMHKQCMLDCLNRSCTLCADS